jgi:hypothetical protein
MYRVAREFVQAHRDDPTMMAQINLDARTELFTYIYYTPERSIYYLHVYLSIPDTDYNFPYMEALSIRIGAAQKFEMLYGRPRTTFEDDAFWEMWTASDWYTRANIVQTVNGEVSIVLGFYADHLY